MNTSQLIQDIQILQESIFNNKNQIEKQISKLKRDLYVTFSIIFLFLFSGLAYQLLNIFK